MALFFQRNDAQILRGKLPCFQTVQHNIRCYHAKGVAMGSLLLIHLPPSRWWRRARWRLYKPLDIANYRVPRGFVTDGISAPWLMAWLISPTGRGFPAAVLHDYLLSLLVGQQSRHDADEAFYQALQQCGVAEWRARGMYLAVRLFALLKGAY